MCVCVRVYLWVGRWVGGWVKADVRLSVSCKPNHLGIERGSAALLVPIPHIDEVCFIVLIYI